MPSKTICDCFVPNQTKLSLSDVPLSAKTGHRRGTKNQKSGNQQTPTTSLPLIQPPQPVNFPTANDVRLPMTMIQVPQMNNFQPQYTQQPTAYPFDNRMMNQRIQTFENQNSESLLVQNRLERGLTDFLGEGTAPFEAPQLQTVNAVQYQQQLQNPNLGAGEEVQVQFPNVVPEEMSGNEPSPLSPFDFNHNYSQPLNHPTGTNEPQNNNYLPFLEQQQQQQEEYPQYQQMMMQQQPPATNSQQGTRLFHPLYNKSQLDIRDAFDPNQRFEIPGSNQLKKFQKYENPSKFHNPQQQQPEWSVNDSSSSNFGYKPQMSSTNHFFSNANILNPIISDPNWQPLASNQSNQNPNLQPLPRGESDKSLPNFDMLVAGMSFSRPFGNNNLNKQAKPKFPPPF